MTFSNRTKNISRTIKLISLKITYYDKETKEVKAMTTEIHEGCTTKELEAKHPELNHSTILDTEELSIREVKANISYSNFLEIAILDNKMEDAND